MTSLASATLVREAVATWLIVRGGRLRAADLMAPPRGEVLARRLLVAQPAVGRELVILGPVVVAGVRAARRELWLPESARRTNPVNDLGRNAPIVAPDPSSSPLPGGG